LIDFLNLNIKVIFSHLIPAALEKNCKKILKLQVIHPPTSVLQLSITYVNCKIFSRKWGKRYAYHLLGKLRNLKRKNDMHTNLGCQIILYQLWMYYFGNFENKIDTSGMQKRDRL
jgi:hypothetical protein